MGEARRRGTFEERKAQAIKAGRIKAYGTPAGYVDKSNPPKTHSIFSLPALVNRGRISKHSKSRQSRKIAKIQRRVQSRG